MASCSKIDNLLQAYIDGELSDSEKVILKQHISECKSCTAVLRRHQRSSARLFEAFSEFRLKHDLTQSVLDNLPEMESKIIDIESVNWRAKHPISTWGRFAQLVPAGVLIGLLLAVGIVWINWPSIEPGENEIGVVAQSSGESSLIGEDDTDRRDVRIQSFVKRGERYETRGPGSSIMLALAGPTYVKLAKDTRVKIEDSRRINVEEGKVWLDVGRDGRLFRVDTPTGEIIVFGTSFEVDVGSGKTTVTVEKGEVQVENNVGFMPIHKGEQIKIQPDIKPTNAKLVDVTSIKKWADRIVTNKYAEKKFQTHIAPKHKPLESHVAQYLRFNITNNRMSNMRNKSLRLTWEFEENINHCGYKLYFMDGNNKSLFMQTVLSGAFSNAHGNSVIIPIDEKFDSNISEVYVRVVPDFTQGQQAVDFKDSYLQNSI